MIATIDLFVIPVPVGNAAADPPYGARQPPNVSVYPEPDPLLIAALLEEFCDQKIV